MRVLFWAFIIVFGFGGNAFGQAGQSYKMDMGLKTENEGKEIIAFSNGDFVTKETIYDRNTREYEIIISRFSECLQLQWAKKFAARGKYNVLFPHERYSCNIAAIENDGVLLVYSDITQYDDCVVIKLDKGSNVIWSKKLNTGFKGSEVWALRCKKNLDDGYIITGSIDSTFTLVNDVLHNVIHFITRIDKNGNILWSKHLNSYGNFPRANFISVDYGHIQVLDDKNILLGVDGAYGTIMKFDSTGNIKWRLSGSNTLDNNGRTINYFNFRLFTVDDSDNIYIGGQFYAPSNNMRGAIGVVKLDKNLQRKWCYLFSDSLSSISMGFSLHNIGITKQNNLILTCADRFNISPNSKTTLIELNLHGEILRAKFLSDLQLVYNAGIAGNYYNHNDFSLTTDSGYIYSSITDKNITSIIKTDKFAFTECNNKDTFIVRSSANVPMSNSNFLKEKSGWFTFADKKILPVSIKYRKSVQCADRFYPDAYLGNDTVICTFQPYILNVRQPVYSQYLWNTGDTTESLEITKSGKYWVSIKSGYCTVSDTVNILFYNQLKKLKTKIATICPYDSFLLQLPGTSLNVEWLNPKGSILQGNHIWIKDPGNYFLKLTNSQTCKIVDTFRLQHHNLPKASAGPDTVLCYNQSYEMQGKGGISYKWIPAKYLSNDTLANPIATAPDTQLYLLVVKNTFGCADTSQMWLKVKPRLEVKITSQNQSVCSGEKVFLQAKASGGDSLHYTYKWQNADVKDAEFEATLLKSTWIKITLEDGCSEPAKDSIFITVKPTPIAAFYTDPKDSAIAENKVQFINQSQNSTNYQWSFGTGETSFTTNPTYIYTDTGKYFITLIAQNTNGCSDTAFGNIYIQDKFRIFIPNAFTPDGDLINDVFSVYGTGIKDYSYEIYNRWGQRIFTSSANKPNWNGSVENRGEVMQMDLYFYVLKVKDNENRMHYLNGTINLLR